MSKQNQVIFKDEEEAGGKLSRKAKEAPFMTIGLIGLIGACGYSAYKFKHRGGMSTSVFLMQTRVVAQGTVVSCLTIGLIYSMVTKHLLHWDEK